MYQLIYSIVITMLLAGCAVQHETINLPEKNEQVVVQDKKETKNVDSEKNISPERQHWKECQTLNNPQHQSAFKNESISQIGLR